MTMRTFFGTKVYILMVSVACAGLVGFAVSRLPWESSTQTTLLALSMIRYFFTEWSSTRSALLVTTSSRSFKAAALFWL
jgi:hypothetical protein